MNKTVGWGLADKLTYGKGKGCGFVNNLCNDTMMYPEFCYPEDSNYKCSVQGDYGEVCYRCKYSDGCYYWNGLNLYAEGKNFFKKKKCFIEKPIVASGALNTAKSSYPITQPYCCTKPHGSHNSSDPFWTLYINYAEKPGKKVTIKCRENRDEERWMNPTDKFSVQCPVDIP